MRKRFSSSDVYSCFAPHVSWQYLIPQFMSVSEIAISRCSPNASCIPHERGFVRLNVCMIYSAITASKCHDVTDHAAQVNLSNENISLQALSVWEVFPLRWELVIVAEDLLSLLQFSVLFIGSPSHHQSNETIAMKNISCKQAVASVLLGWSHWLLDDHTRALRWKWVPNELNTFTCHPFAHPSHWKSDISLLDLVGFALHLS